MWGGGSLAPSSSVFFLLRAREISIRQGFDGLLGSAVSAHLASGSWGHYHVGNYLGMDTHDTHQLSKDLPLRPGMVPGPRHGCARGWRVC